MLTAQAKLFQLITDFLRYIVVREDKTPASYPPPPPPTFKENFSSDLKFYC